MLDKTLKSTKFWAAVGTTVATSGAMAAHSIDFTTGAQLIAGIWSAFILGRGIEDAGVKGAKIRAEK